MLIMYRINDDVATICRAATMDPESFDRSNYMHRAMIRVAYKFAHEMPVNQLLSKVGIFSSYRMGQKNNENVFA